MNRDHLDSTNFQTEHSKQVPEDSEFLTPEGEGTKEKVELSHNQQASDVSSEQQYDLAADEVKSESSKRSQLSVMSDSEYVIEDEEPVMDEQEMVQQENVRLQFEDEEMQNFQDEQLLKIEKSEKQAVKSRFQKGNINLRPFQATLIESSRDRNSIIYLPTGTGKTRIAICSMYYYLCKYGTSKKIVFLANTIQLVKQQAEAIKQTLGAIINNQSFAKDLRQKLGGNYIELKWSEKDLNNQVICVHGERSEDPTITRRKRIEAYLTTKKQFLNQMKKATITVMISQMFLNCLRRGYIKLTDYSFMVFDECHHCGGDHPYSGIMKQFYFEQKKKLSNDEKLNRLREEESRLPILMGLTASPVSQPFNDYKTLTKELKNLCVNLDSNYSYYPFGDQITNKTEILIEKIQEKEGKEMIPDLMDYLNIYKRHKDALDKLKIHFREYYDCIKRVIDLMSSKHDCLRVQVEGSKIVDPELYLLYDIKQCLLLKLRDLWLQLGEFAFYLGFHEMNIELSRLTGLRNQENTLLLDQVKQVLREYDFKFKQKFGRCEMQYFSSKIVRLIEILRPESEEQKLQEKVSDMVLVFAFKRRTVKYLQLVLEKYRDLLPENQKKFFKSVGVTGYAARQKVYRLQDGHSFQSNPSAQQDQFTISKLYGTFVQREREQMRNRIHMQSSFVTDNETLTSEMNRLFYSKMGKMLLEVQEKYNNQIRKIIEFKKKEHRVLITTSVTEEGFDIPGCNLVISFDTPFGMKSYIQIKGRARKKNSKYFIFTTEKFYEKMLENKKVYDNTIHAIYELAINHISKEDIDALERIIIKSSYEKVPTKGGALLNTNYALELLKSYFTSLKQPNKAYFHFIETSNICFKCVIKFPESSTCSKGYVVGKPQPKKLEAMKSAAFEAVKLLKKQGFLRDDLRPSRLQQLQDELQLQRYDDLGLYSKDASYRQILDRYVQIQEDTDPQTQKKLVRFFFKSLPVENIQFSNLNRRFDFSRFEGGEEFPFQIYLVKFSNNINTYLLSEQDSVHEIGILTCFEKEQTEQIFARFRQHLQHSCQEQFQLRLVEKSLLLTRVEYEKLKTVHNFLLNAEKKNQTDYYNYLNKCPPVLFPSWLNDRSKHKIKIDERREHFPLMVLLRGLREGKATNYQIDALLNKKIVEHIDLFKRIYNYHNKPARYNYEKAFEQNLTNHYRLLYDTVKSQDCRTRKYLVQCLTNQNCFHKVLLSTRVIEYNKQIEKEDQARKKYRLKPRYQKLKKQFVHFKEEKDIFDQAVVKVFLYRNAAKEDLNEILNKEIKIKKVEDDKGIYSFLKEYVLYPVSYPTMLRVSLVSKYVFQVFEDHSLALYFRKFYLSDIFSGLKPKLKANKQLIKPYYFAYYKSVILQYSDKIYSFMRNAGKSRHLRDLGRFLMSGVNMNFSNLRNDISSIDHGNVSFDGLQGKINPNSSNILNNSLLKEQEESFEVNMFKKKQEEKVGQKQENGEKNIKKEEKKEDDKGQRKLQRSRRINLGVLNNLKIQDILRALTSKIYRHQKMFNYQQFEFIGDVVLKYLATIQIFLQKTVCEEGEMHIARANIICNANLHRAAIRKKLFQFIFTTKQKTDPAPIVKMLVGVEKISEHKRFGNTDIQLLDRDDQEVGYQFIPGKVHADVMQALIGIFYLKNKSLQDCQTLLYAFGILNQPNLQITFDDSKQRLYNLPVHLAGIEAKLNYTFKHKQFLVQALTHPSFLRYMEEVVDEDNSFSRLFNASEMKADNSQILNLSMLADQTTNRNCLILKHQTFYERMEFLGDAFLDLLVVEYLYDQGGDYLDDEGTLSFLKQSAVSNKTLGFIALKENFQDYLFIDMDEIDQILQQFRRISRDMDYLPSPLRFSKLKIGSLKILGDVFQSLVGAILIDNEFRYEQTKAVVMGLMQKYIKHFTSITFVEQCPTYKYKEYLDQNNYKKYKLVKVIEQGIVNGEYMYKLTDKSGNVIGEPVRASNDKNAWDVLLEQSKQ